MKNLTVTDVDVLYSKIQQLEKYREQRCLKLTPNEERMLSLGIQHLEVVHEAIQRRLVEQ